MTHVNKDQNTESERNMHSIEDLTYLVGLHAKTRAMNKKLSPVLERTEAEAIARLETAKAGR